MRRANHAHLIEAVSATLGEERFDIGVTQHIILGCPLNNLNIAAHRKAAIAKGYQVRLRKLPQGLGRGYCRQPLCNLCKLGCLCMQQCMVRSLSSQLHAVGLCLSPQQKNVLLDATIKTLNQETARTRSCCEGIMHLARMACLLRLV